MKIPRTHLLVLVSMCCLIAVNLGLLSNVQGLFLGPMAEELGVLKGTVSLTITISSICGGLGGMLVPHLMGTKRFRLLVGALAALSCASTAALGLCRGIVGIYALCVVRGLVSGMLGMVFATSILGNWFHANLGLFTSIAVGSSGIAGSAFSLVFSDIIESFGWRAGYLAMAAFSLALMLPTVLFVPAVKPEDCRRVAFGENPMRTHESSRAGSAGAVAPTPAAIVAAIVAFAVLSHGPASLSQHLPGVGQSYGLAVGIGATMLSAAMITNTVGKVAFGALADRMGTRHSILLYSVLVCVALAGLLLVRGTGMLIGSSAVFGLTFSLNTVGVTMATRDLCGPENYGRVYPLATLAGSISYAVLSSAHGYAYDFTGGYTLSLCGALVMLVAAAAAISLAYARTQTR